MQFTSGRDVEKNFGHTTVAVGCSANDHLLAASKRTRANCQTTHSGEIETTRLTIHDPSHMG